VSSSSSSLSLQDQIKEYEYSHHDVQLLISKEEEFARLQRSLRHKGAVTNELLKQVLPLVIRQSQQQQQQQQQQQHDDLY